MKHEKLLGKVSNGKKEEGFTLLEYVAGAAIIIGIVALGLTQMGTGLQNFFTGVGTWASNQAPANQD